MCGYPARRFRRGVDFPSIASHLEEYYAGHPYSAGRTSHLAVDQECLPYKEDYGTHAIAVTSNTGLGQCPNLLQTGVWPQRVPFRPNKPPAMAWQLTDHLWDLGEMYDAATATL